MREILFRGKRVDNGEWVEGYVWSAGDEMVFIRSREYADEEHFQLIDHFVSPETICQYTGMRDRNGERIFEGDVFEFADTKYPGEYRKQILFDRGMWCESFLSYPDRTSKFTESQCDAIVIIGNMHDKEQP